MTFRGRLRLFFTIIVIVPMVAIAAVLFALTADSERGKADARLAAGLDAALLSYEDGREAAADQIGRMRAPVRAALTSADAQTARNRLRQWVRSDPRIVSATLSDANGNGVIRAGSPHGIAPATFRLRGPGGRLRGTLSVSVTDARDLVRSAAERPRSAARAPRLEFLALKGGKAVAGIVPGEGRAPRDFADFEADGRDYRGRRLLVGKPGGVPEEIAVFVRADELNSAISESRVLIGAIIVAFLGLALYASVFVVRALQRQIEQFLEAARRLASGRFDQPVPTEGRDEFAELGREFNSMSDQLEAKIDEVERKRRQLQETMRTAGRALSAGLDRQGVVELTVKMTLDACEAEAARARPIETEPSLFVEAHAGSQTTRLIAALEHAERSALSIGPEISGEPPAIRDDVGRTGNARGPAVVEHEGLHALALPLRVRPRSRKLASCVGVISIARCREAFYGQETDLLQYLVAQAETSIENADLHETLQQEAITDPLTGLSNRRQMHNALDHEFSRRRRSEAPLALMMLDIDDFRQVNSGYGWLQGDQVLLAVARILCEFSRDFDEPVRWGGEEFAVVAPMTDGDGAVKAAERMREEIEKLRVPRLDGAGELRVTASFGVAAVPESAADRESLVAAALAALSRAKRNGKNRVERAAEDDG